MPSSVINDSSSVRRLLVEAKEGRAESLGRLLQHYENYLRLLAVTHLDDQIRGRLSPSDVVQETMLDAHCDFEKFRGNSDREFFSWLRKILVNNLARAVEQHVLTAKRDVRREVSRIQINASLDRSTSRLAAMLADSSPSPDSDLSTQEQLVQLANALTEIPSDYRDVIVWRHLEGVPFSVIADRMQRSSGATRMLWLRAIEQLRQKMRGMDS